MVIIVDYDGLSVSKSGALHNAMARRAFYEAHKVSLLALGHHAAGHDTRRAANFLQDAPGSSRLQSGIADG